MKTFNINSNTKKEFFRKYLLIINTTIGLRPVARQVFALMLYWNDIYKDLPKDDRNMLLFNKTTRKKILEELKISRASLDNQFTYLRKKEVLLGNTLNPLYEFFYETHNQLLFLFNINTENND